MSDRLLASHRGLSISRKMSVRREEYLDILTFRRPGPPIFTEIFGPLVGLKEEWAGLGASPAELDFSAFRYRDAIKYGVRAQTGWMGGREPTVLTETETDIVGRDRYGRTVRLVKRAATLPLPLDYPVATMDDWRALRHHYAFSEARFGTGWLEEARARRDQGCVITASVPGAFDEPRQLMGEAGLCEAYYTRPDLVHDMLETIAETACRVLERVADRIGIDVLQIHEDMAGKTGPLIGPRQVEQFLAPYYRRVWQVVRDRGTPLFDQDSAGDMRPVLDAFLDTGLNTIHPNEPAAGMDIVALRKRYGTRLVLVGGIDKHVLRRSREEIEAELEYKIPPMVRTGGCVLGLDHRIPNGTPLESYRFYISKAWEIMRREWSEISGEIMTA